MEAHNKITEDLNDPLIRKAATTGHRMVLGPGEPALSEWAEAKLLLPDVDDEVFKAVEIAERLKMQLKKLELIRLFSDQLLKKKRLLTYLFGL